MVEILIQYADRTMKKCPDQGKIQVMEQYFQVQYFGAVSFIYFFKEGTPFLFAVQRKATTTDKQFQHEFKPWH